MHEKTRPGRRAFLKASAISAVALTPALTPALRGARAASDANPTSDDFTYEVTRTDAEWKARLTDDEYHILRKGGTEKFNASPYHGEMPDGTYACKGCDLPLYDSKWKKVVDMGFVFFKQSHPNAVLTGIDIFNPYKKKTDEVDALIEVHCRRCGSHMGHILIVTKGNILHCINGTSLQFTPASA